MAISSSCQTSCSSLFFVFPRLLSFLIEPANAPALDGGVAGFDVVPENEAEGGGSRKGTGDALRSRTCLFRHKPPYLYHGNFFLSPSRTPPLTLVQHFPHTILQRELSSIWQRTSKSTILEQIKHFFWPTVMSPRPSRFALAAAFCAFRAALRTAFAAASSRSTVLPTERTAQTVSLSRPARAKAKFFSLRFSFLNCFLLLELHRFEQVVTSSQQRSHFLRQVNGRLHDTHTFCGKLPLCTPRVMTRSGTLGKNRRRMAK